MSLNLFTSYIAYFNSCCLICKLYHPISTNAVSFASYIVLFQHMSSYLQAMSSYLQLISSYFQATLSLFKLLYHLIFTPYIILFSTHIKILLPHIRTYLQTSFHPICNYVMLFLSSGHIFSPSNTITLFLEICLYNIVIAIRNSQWHCPLKDDVNTTPYYTA